MKKFIIILSVICVVWTFIVLPVSAGVKPYGGVSHKLTDATLFGNRHEEMTIVNNEDVTIEVDAVVEVYVKGSYASGSYLTDFRIPKNGKKKISSNKHKNTNYGIYKYYICSNTGKTWGASGKDW